MKDTTRVAVAEIQRQMRGMAWGNAFSVKVTLGKRS